MLQVEQVENEETKNSPDADTGKNVEYWEARDQTDRMMQTRRRQTMAKS